MLSVRPGLLRALVVPAALVAALALPRSASAQTTTGSISGTVTDPQGQAVPGATVTIIH
jgi:protocatechuate 3,4-dioxygenase beta subunit